MQQVGTRIILYDFVASCIGIMSAVVVTPSGIELVGRCDTIDVVEISTC